MTLSCLTIMHQWNHPYCGRKTGPSQLLLIIWSLSGNTNGDYQTSPKFLYRSHLKITQTTDVRFVYHAQIHVLYSRRLGFDMPISREGNLGLVFACNSLETNSATYSVTDGRLCLPKCRAYSRDETHSLPFLCFVTCCHIPITS